MIVFTWYAGSHIENAVWEKKRPLFFGSIAVIVFNLLLFKYGFVFSFRFSTTNPVIQSQGESSILAPLGLSYITLQAIGYLYEISNAQHRAEKHLGYLSTFFLFFPKILAGPVERAHNFLPQLKNIKSFAYNDISIGLKLIVWGMFKKLVVADRLAIYTNAIFENVDQHSGISLFVAVVFYVFQLYADLSGYTDMARGVARLLGFNLAINFDLPLLSKSVTQFWSRWHISLSSWFKDYIYEPAAKFSKGRLSIAFAFFLSLVTFGLWHSVSNTFLIFGLLHGLMLTIEYFSRVAVKKRNIRPGDWFTGLFGIIYTFSFFAFTLIFFKADNLEQAFLILKKIASFKGPFYNHQLSLTLFSLLSIAFILSIEIKRGYFKNVLNLHESKYWLVRNSHYFFLLVFTLVAGVFDGLGFIYAKF